MLLILITWLAEQYWLMNYLNQKSGLQLSFASVSYIFPLKQIRFCLWILPLRKGRWIILSYPSHSLIMFLNTSSSKIYMGIWTMGNFISFLLTVPCSIIIMRDNRKENRAVWEHYSLNFASLNYLSHKNIIITSLNYLYFNPYSLNQINLVFI